MFSMTHPHHISGHPWASASRDILQLKFQPRTAGSRWWRPLRTRSTNRRNKENSARHHHLEPSSCNHTLKQVHFESRKENFFILLCISGDQIKDQTGGNILEQALLLSSVQPFSSPAIVSPPISTEDPGQKRRQSNTIQAGSPGKQRKTPDNSSTCSSINTKNSSTTTTRTKCITGSRVKDWRRKFDREIEENEKVIEETSAETEVEELEVTGLNNVLAGRRGKMTLSERKHPFSLQTEKARMKSEIDSLSEELKTKRTMRTQNKKSYVGLLQNLSAARKDYLKLIQAEKEEVKREIGRTPFIKISVFSARM